MSRPVLLVIDLLNDYFREGPLLDERQALTRAVNELVEVFRRSGNAIIWVRQEFAQDLHDAPIGIRRKAMRITVAGTDGARLLPELDRSPEDLEVIKKRYSAFFQTDLDDTLQRLEANPIVLTGVNTHACIRTTAIDAYQRDLDVILASECVRSYDQAHHTISLGYLDGRIARVMTNAQIRVLLSKGDDSRHAA